MTQKSIILKRDDDDYTGHDKDGSGDGADNLDSWDDDLKEEEKKDNELGGLDDAGTADDEDGNY